MVRKGKRRRAFERSAAESTLRWEPVCQAHESVTEYDKECLLQMLGFVPSNLYMVKARDPDTKAPQACIMYPLSNTARQEKLEPFPTICWLTCTKLKGMVSALERDGWVQNFEQRLREKTETCGKRMVVAHRLYARYRTAMLTEPDLELVRQSGWEAALSENRGVAGITNNFAHLHKYTTGKVATTSLEQNGGAVATTWELSVKCLHAHLAHYLCFPQHGNVIGRWTYEALGLGETDRSLPLKSIETERDAGT